MLKRWKHESSWEQDVHLASSTYPSKRVSKKMLLHLFIITMMMYVSLNHSQCQPPSHRPIACRAHRSQCYWSYDKRCTFNAVALPHEIFVAGANSWLVVQAIQKAKAKPTKYGSQAFPQTRTPGSRDHLVVQRTTFWESEVEDAQISSQGPSQGSSLTWRFLT